jgi:hypothetical protein
MRTAPGVGRIHRLTGNGKEKTIVKSLKSRIAVQNRYKILPIESGRRVAASLVGQSAQPIGFTIGLSIAPVVGESAPVYTPVSYAAIGNDKIGEIAQEPVMPPALTCIRGENNR